MRANERNNEERILPRTERLRGLVSSWKIMERERGMIPRST